MTVSEKNAIYRRLATQALQMQDACNLTAIVNGFSRVMTELTRMGLGTEQANCHPVAKLWADKIAHLTGIPTLGIVSCPELSAAYDWADRMRGEA